MTTQNTASESALRSLLESVNVARISSGFYVDNLAKRLVIVYEWAMECGGEGDGYEFRSHAGKRLNRADVRRALNSIDFVTLGKHHSAALRGENLAIEPAHGDQ